MAAENQQKLTKTSDFHCGDKNAFLFACKLINMHMNTFCFA